MARLMQHVFDRSVGVDMQTAFDDPHDQKPFRSPATSAPDAKRLKKRQGAIEMDHLGYRRNSSRWSRWVHIVQLGHFGQYLFPSNGARGVEYWTG